MDDIAETLRVVDLSDRSGGWDCSRFSRHIPSAVLDAIYALPAPSVSAGKDRVAWRLTCDGCFTHKSAYESLIDSVNSLYPNLFKCIWRWPGPESYKYFLWCVGNRSLLTNMAWKRRGLTEVSTCVVCNQNDESMLHILRDCNKIRPVWLSLVNGGVHNNFWHMDIEEWLFTNLVERMGIDTAHWKICFGVALRVLWLSRNDLVFNNKEFRIK